MWTPIIDRDGIPCSQHPVSGQLVRMDGELLDPIMQFSGLKDKNGKDICEGDVVNDARFNYGIGKVRFHKGCFEVGFIDDKFENGCYAILCTFSDNDGLEVIGNIYEYKHLLAEDV